jgi:ribonuclease G
LPWFRRRKQKLETPQAEPAAAPIEEAPAEAPEVEAPAEPAPTGEDTPKTTTRRRRGSRGGRNRRKPAPATQPEAKTEPKEAPKPAATKRPERRPDRGSSSRSGQRRRVATKRAALPAAKRELVISADIGEQRVAVLEDGQVAEVYLERPERRSIAGNIYKGKVDNVLPGMEAAFVEIGLEKNGFLFVDEIVGPELEGKGQRKIQDLIARGQEVLVQAVKDPMKSKGARLTTEISLPGRFIVFVPSGEGLGVSRRLEDDERIRLREILKKLDLPKGGVIVRTAAEGASAEDIERDLLFLQRLWDEIQKHEHDVKAPSLVYQESELPLRVVRDLFTDDFERAMIDDDATYKRVTGYLKKTSPHMVERVVRDREKEPLFERFGVDREIRSTLSRRVDLPSGGYLIFDYAEAFTVIDVNTGRFTGSRSKSSGARLEDTITKNNLEAVKEVVRQLRLRDIGGIIVIDFIDMANPKNRALVEDALRTELERDRTKTYVVEISPLGLVEMTRQNVTDGPREILTTRCTVCGGDGILISEATAAIEIERQLRGLARQSRSQAFRVELNARVAALLVGPGAAKLMAIEEQARRRFYLVPRKDVDVEHFNVVAQGPRSKLAPSNGLEEGAEARIELGEVGLYDAEAGVGRLNGHAVIVGNAAKMVGKKVKVRIERVLDGVAYGSLLTQPGKQAATVAPVTAELEALKPTRQPRRRKPAGAETGDLAVEEETAEEDVTATAEEIEDETEAETDDATGTAEAADPDKPKRRTRRGSRGGRRRRKPTTAAAAAQSDSEPAQADGGTAQSDDGEANGQVGARIHIPEPDLGQDEPEAVAEAAEEPSQNGAQGEETPKPRRRTRRGSRGGRNRRKKPAATTEKTADS